MICYSKYEQVNCRDTCRYSCVEILTSKVLEVGPRDGIRSEDGALMNGISVPVEKAQEPHLSLLPHENTERGLLPVNL